MIRVICIFCAIVFHTMASNSEVSERLAKVPPSDQKILEEFFKLLLSNSPMAYTLFGKKPMSDAGFFYTRTGASFRWKSEFEIEKGWETWLRYQSLFPSDAFVLKRVLHDFSQEFVLIHKGHALAELEENLDIVHETWEEDTSSEFLSRVIDQDSYDPCSSRLAGILYGFGRANAVNTKLDSLSVLALDYEKKASDEVYPGFDLPGGYVWYDFVQWPRFTVHDKEEEKRRLESYGATRIAIRKAYREGPFLEVTLKQFMHPQEKS